MMLASSRTQTSQADASLQDHSPLCWAIRPPREIPIRVLQRKSDRPHSSSPPDTLPNSAGHGGFQACSRRRQLLSSVDENPGGRCSAGSQPAPSMERHSLKQDVPPSEPSSPQTSSSASSCSDVLTSTSSCSDHDFNGTVPGVRDPLSISSGQRTAMEEYVDEVARLELERFAVDNPRLHLSLKRALACEDAESSRLSKRHRPSPELEGAPGQDAELPPGSTTYRSDYTEEVAWLDEGTSSTDSTLAAQSGNTSPTSAAYESLTQRGQTSFPCPYATYNHSGSLCSHQAFGSPRLVEEHLFLHHRRPPFCPRCGLVLSTHAQCNEHIIARSCELTDEMPFVEGLSETQTKELSLCLDPRMSKISQYKAMWEVVHPGVGLLGRCQDLDCALAEEALRDHWEENGGRVVREIFAGKHPDVYADESDWEYVQAAVFGRIVERLRGGERVWL